MDLRNSLLARGAQRRQVVRDRRPDLAAVDLVVFVPQAIANAADVPPRLIGRQLLANAPSFLAASLMRNRQCWVASNVFASARNCCSDMPAV